MYVETRQGHKGAPIGPTGLDPAQLGAAVRCSPGAAELAEGTPALFARSAADAWVSVQSGGQGERSPAAIPSGQGVREGVRDAAGIWCAMRFAVAATTAKGIEFLRRAASC
jgi:hypothetical protein